MNKKFAIGVCAAGLILCFIGVFMIAYAMGKSKSADNKPASTAAESVAVESEAKEEAKEEAKAETKDETKESSEEAKQESGSSSEENTEAVKADEIKEPVVVKDGELMSSDAAYPSVCGALSVKGTQLVDKSGNPVQLRGISSHGLSWFPTFINQEAFKQFRNEWNVNVMRLAMYTAEGGGYCTDGNKEDLKNIIYRGVQYATDYDMYVIIDWHILSDQDPNKYKDEAKQFFADMSAKYKDSDNIIYEICNEPNGGTSWAQIKSYAEEIIPVIRANDKDAVILVGTPNWSQRVDEAAKDPIKDYDNIMYTLHFYAATHKDDLRKTMSNAIDNGLPVFVSEYGICDASGNGGLDKDSAKKWVDLMNEKGVSYVCWALANKNESAALIKCTSNKTCQYTADDLSDSGKWLYETLTGTAPVSDGSAKKEEPKTEQSAGDNTEFQSGGLEGIISLKSKWEADGKECFQYDLSLKNPGNQDLNSWAIDIHFSNDVEVDNSWGGNYTVNGNTVHITNVDYNKNIKAGDYVRDLGFVVIAPAGTTLTQ